MRNIATLKLGGSNDEVCAIVRSSSNRIGLCLSKRDEGDVEVFMSREECKTLIDALVKSVN